MYTQFKKVRIMLIVSSLMLPLYACTQPKVFVGTGTLVGIEATPGNPNEGQTPAVTFGYRRAEVAVVPVAKENQRGKQNSDGVATEDAASALVTFNLAHNWFGPARIEQYVATGHAARNLLKGEHHILALIGYERGTDTLTDQLAEGYKQSIKEKATDSDKACWNSITQWMKTHFEGLATTDILTKGFTKQRPEAAKDAAVKAACKLP